jgi:type VI secretion system secreted protein Hcp
MPTPAYLSVTGVKQGLITAGTFTQDSVGNIYQEGHEDQILVQAFSHQVIIPRDPQSGQPTGQRVHKPMMISKVFDKSSPLLFSALTSGEEVKCRLEWLRTSSAGTQEHYFTIELEGDHRGHPVTHAELPGSGQRSFHSLGRRLLHLSQDRVDPRSVRHIRVR